MVVDSAPQLIGVGAVGTAIKDQVATQPVELREIGLDVFDAPGLATLPLFLCDVCLRGRAVLCLVMPPSKRGARESQIIDWWRLGTRELLRVAVRTKRARRFTHLC